MLSASPVHAIGESEGQQRSGDLQSPPPAPSPRLSFPSTDFTRVIEALRQENQILRKERDELASQVYRLKNIQNDYEELAAKFNRAGYTIEHLTHELHLARASSGSHEPLRSLSDFASLVAERGEGSNRNNNNEKLAPEKTVPPPQGPKKADGMSTPVDHAPSTPQPSADKPRAPEASPAPPTPLNAPNFGMSTPSSNGGSLSDHATTFGAAPKGGAALSIVQQPPSKAVYQRILKPFPCVAIHGVNTSDHASYFVEVSLVKADPSQPHSLRPFTVAGIPVFEPKDESLQSLLAGQLVQRSTPGETPSTLVVCFKKLKILTTTAQQGALFALRFALKRYSDASFEFVQNVPAILSTPMEIVSHTLYMKTSAGSTLFQPSASPSPVPMLTHSGEDSQQADQKPILINPRPLKRQRSKLSSSAPSVTVPVAMTQQWRTSSVSSGLLSPPLTSPGTSAPARSSSGTPSLENDPTKHPRLSALLAEAAELEHMDENLPDATLSPIPSTAAVTLQSGRVSSATAAPSSAHSSSSIASGTSSHSSQATALGSLASHHASLASIASTSASLQAAASGLASIQSANGQQNSHPPQIVSSFPAAAFSRPSVSSSSSSSSSSSGSLLPGSSASSAVATTSTSPPPSVQVS